MNNLSIYLVFELTTTGSLVSSRNHVSKTPSESTYPSHGLLNKSQLYNRRTPVVVVVVCIEEMYLTFWLQSKGYTCFKLLKRFKKKSYFSTCKNLLAIGVQMYGWIGTTRQTN